MMKDNAIPGGSQLARLIAEREKLLQEHSKHKAKEQEALDREIAWIENRIARQEILNPLNVRGCTTADAFHSLEFMSGTFFRKLTGFSRNVKEENDAGRRAEMERVENLCREFEERINYLVVPFQDMMLAMGDSAMYMPAENAAEKIDLSRRQLEVSLQGLKTLVDSIVTSPYSCKSQLP